jgi:hypothetical protein
MAINEKSLSKCQIRKLNALRKSLGDKIADSAFTQWMKEQPANNDDISYHDLVIGPPFFSHSPMAPTFETFV